MTREDAAEPVRPNTDPLELDTEALEAGFSKTLALQSVRLDVDPKTTLRAPPELPNILPIHTLCWSEDEGPVIVMKRIEGESWAELLRRDGPEVNLVFRGKAKLVEGEAFVSFPDHFELLSVPGSATATLTPMSRRSQGLSVEMHDNGFTAFELFDGRGTYEFSYVVYSQRVGYEDFKPIQKRSEGPYPKADDFAPDLPKP